MIEAIFFSFTAIFFAELLDKSQLTVLLLSSKTKKHAQLLLGVLLAFVLVDGSAIFFGTIISQIIPAHIMRLLAGFLFILFGILSLRSSNEETKQSVPLKNVFFSGFTLVFFSEWGDKTQLASAIFAAKYPPLFVFFGVVSALFILSLLAITVGSVLLARVKKKTVSRISGIVFISLGLFFFLT